MKKVTKAVTAVTMSGILAMTGLWWGNSNQKINAEVGNNLSKISNPIAGGENGSWEGNYIYFGHYPQSLKSGAAADSTNPNDFNNDPIKWRVLDINNVQWDESKSIEENGLFYNGGGALDHSNVRRQNAPIDGNGILLMADKCLHHMVYHPSGNANELCWAGGAGGSEKGCTLWAWLNNYDRENVLGNVEIPANPFFTTAFTELERNSISYTKVYSEDLYKTRNGKSDYASSPRTSLSTDKMFLLSYIEMLNSKYGFIGDSSRVLMNTQYAHNVHVQDHKADPPAINATVFYFLRSPANVATDTWMIADTWIVDVSPNGELRPEGDLCNHGNISCVPAMNLNLNSVLFASNANDSGKSINVGNVPSAFSLETGTGKEYKLTVLDSSKKISIDSEKSWQKNDKVVVAYKDATLGENNFISCLIADKENPADILYYGKLGKINSTTGTVNLILPDNVKDGNYVIKIFAEECNGAKETDFASEPQILEIDADGEIGFAAPKHPNIQGIDVRPESHSQRVGAQDVFVTLMGENFTSNFKVKLQFKKEGDGSTVLTYPEQGAIFADSTPNHFEIKVPADEVKKWDVGNYIVEAVIENN